MAIQAILFDLDNTLLNRKLAFDAYAAYFVERFVACSHPEEAEAFARQIVSADQSGYRPKRELYTQLCSQLPMKDSKTTPQLLLDTWFAEFPRFYVLMEGAVPVLQQFRARGLKLGLVTNGSVRAQSNKIKLAGLEPYFDTILISDDVQVKKPMPEIFQMALQRLGVPADQAVFVGDHPQNDIRGAQEAGLHAIWLHGFMDWPPGIDRPRYVIHHLHEADEIIANLHIR